MEELQLWIDRCLQGDQQYYAKIYDHFAPALYRLCYALVLHRQDAEDVLQEAFVYAFKNLKRFDPTRASFKTWLYTIAVSRCRNVYRRKLPLLLDIGQMFALAAPLVEAPEAAYEERDAQYAVKQALGHLSPLLREAVVLRYGHGLTYREIAEMLDCPQKTVESRVRLAHEKLRDMLQPALIESWLSVEML